MVNNQHKPQNNFTNILTAPNMSNNTLNTTDSPWRRRRIRKRSHPNTITIMSVLISAIIILSTTHIIQASSSSESYIKSQPTGSNNLIPTNRNKLPQYITTTYNHYLNKTTIINNPILFQRYEWVRQSNSLVKLLDYEQQIESRQLQSYNKQRQRRLADDDAINDDIDDMNDDINSNVVYDDAYIAVDDAAAANLDDAAVTDDAATDDDASKQGFVCEDKTCTVNEQCTKFLFGFLEGTTDAKDNCEGIMNAYVAADCGVLKSSSSSYTGGSSSSNKNADTTIYNMDDDFNDDYFGIFYDHQCCSSLRSHYYEYCDSSEIINGYNLLVVAAVMLLCECAKSIVKKNRIRWLPEAASCMLVGMIVALGGVLGAYDIENIGFDEEIFMYLLLPPIIFEAALSVNKREFRRRRGAIMVFAVFGTLLSSFVTGAATYYSAQYFGNTRLSILDSLVFGSLISSIDPVAILSVLTSLKMSETDTIYILVFGESLLNDGIAITLFKSLVQQYENMEGVTVDDILGSIADFLIIAFGSFAIGLICGIACLCYFHLNSSILHPVMEVASFFLWAVVPYWMSESFGWSGIVAIVVMGFFMDIYLRPGWDPADLELEEERRLMMLASTSPKMHHGPLEGDHKVGLEYYNWEDDDQTDDKFRFRGTAVDIPDIRKPPSASLPPAASIDGSQSGMATNKAINNDKDNDDADTAAGSITTNPNIRAILMKREFVRMSREADEHVRFVAHLLSSLSENAIFAYLGLFLFSSKYAWDAILCTIGVTTCVLSRAVMVVSASWFIWYMHVFRQRAGCNNRGVDPCIDECLQNEQCTTGESIDASHRVNNPADPVDPLNTPISKSARALSNYKVQVVLILAGLRGAVSLALVESVPIYNGVSGIGSKNKPVLKAMTSSAIIFTIFVLGGGAYYILKWLDITSDDMLIKNSKKKKKERVGYIYPPLVCGVYSGSGPGEYQAPEMELSTAPSWRTHPSSPTIKLDHLTLSRPPSNLEQTDVSPTRISRSRSDWSADYDAVGLNDISGNDPRILQQPSGDYSVHTVHTEAEDSSEMYRSVLDVNEEEAPPSPFEPEIV